MNHFPGTATIGPGQHAPTCSCGWEGKPRATMTAASLAATSHAKNHGMVWNGFRWEKVA